MNTYQSTTMATRRQMQPGMYARGGAHAVNRCRSQLPPRKSPAQVPSVKRINVDCAKKGGALFKKQLLVCRVNKADLVAKHPASPQSHKKSTAAATRGKAAMGDFHVIFPTDRYAVGIFLIVLLG
uniref:Uncharacterized protein n=1 Tax=Bursaphelenchus xylophilus TaxID=6326 RepID=A0A1I7S1L9_BURXY